MPRERLSGDLRDRFGFSGILLQSRESRDNVLFQFDNFLIDTDRRELRGTDGVIHVEPQVFDLLLHFAENTDRVISKDELIERVWKGRAVSDAALNSRINSARRAVGDTGEKQALIRTVPRRGFLFAATVKTGTADPPSSGAQAAPPKLALPDKPSIAVLPFANLSGDPEQEYFADGVVEEIITGLSRIKWLFVIARNSSFTYKGRAVDVKQVGRELGVRYVVEGSVRKAGDRVRVSAQLAVAETGVHLWAERYDRLLEDIFALQDEITLSVVGAIEPSLRDAEIERVKRKRPDSLDAYDLMLRAIPHAYVATPEGAAKAAPLLERALTLRTGLRGRSWLARLVSRDPVRLGWIRSGESCRLHPSRASSPYAWTGRRDRACARRVRCRHGRARPCRRARSLRTCPRAEPLLCAGTVRRRRDAGLRRRGRTGHRLGRARSAAQST